MEIACDNLAAIEHNVQLAAEKPRLTYGHSYTSVEEDTIILECSRLTRPLMPGNVFKKSIALWTKPARHLRH